MPVFTYVTLYGDAQFSIMRSLLLPCTVMQQPHMRDPSEDSNTAPRSVRRIYLNVYNCNRNRIHNIDVCQYTFLNSVRIIDFMVAVEMNTASDVEISFSATSCYRNPTFTVPILHY
jgi:hypothetical protein